MRFWAGSRTGTLVALLVLCAGAGPIRAAEDPCDEYLTRTQREDGSWPGTDALSDAATTALVLRAFTFYGQHALSGR